MKKKVIIIVLASCIVLISLFLVLFVTPVSFLTSKLETYSLDTIAQYIPCERIQIDFQKKAVSFIKTQKVIIELHDMQKESTKVVNGDEIGAIQQIETADFDISYSLEIPDNSGRYKVKITQQNTFNNRITGEFILPVDTGRLECIMNSEHWGMNITENNYSFKIPTDWNYPYSNPGKEGSSFGEKATTKDSDGNNIDVIRTGFTIRVFETKSELPGNDNNSDLNTWINNTYKPLKEGESIKSLTFGKDDYKGIEISKFKEVGVIQIVPRVYLERKGIIYEFTGYAPSLSSEEVETDYDYGQVFYEILNTIEIK